MYLYLYQILPIVYTYNKSNSTQHIRHDPFTSLEKKRKKRLNDYPRPHPHPHPSLLTHSPPRHRLSHPSSFPSIIESTPSTHHSKHPKDTPRTMLESVTTHDVPSANQTRTTHSQAKKKLNGKEREERHTESLQNLPPPFVNSVNPFHGLLPLLSAALHPSSRLVICWNVSVLPSSTFFLRRRSKCNSALRKYPLGHTHSGP